MARRCLPYEVSAPAGYDCDHTPVGVHVNAEDLQGEQTITVEKVNHKWGFEGYQPKNAARIAERRSSYPQGG